MILKGPRAMACCSYFFFRLCSCRMRQSLGRRVFHTLHARTTSMTKHRQATCCPLAHSHARTLAHSHTPSHE